MENEDKLALFDQLMENGYTALDATKMVEDHAGRYESLMALKSKVNLARIVPIRFVTELSHESLWEIGFDTRKYNYEIDTCCYYWEGKLECGEVVYGAERTDKAWTNMIVEGEYVASDEARYGRMHGHLTLHDITVSALQSSGKDSDNPIID